jgi:hydrogenase maturation protease
MRNKIIVLGLGNILLSDEGVGVHAVEALLEYFDFPEGVWLVDGGTLGLDLLPWIEGVEKALFIDAINLRKEPGAIAVLEDEDIPSYLEPKFSFHHVGLSDLLFTSTFMGIRPGKVVLIGMQPEKMEVGLTLSATVSENFEKLLQAILEKLREWGLEIGKKTNRELFHVPGHPI